ncbi:MAG: hypothetical protein M9919_11040 [Burkholderiaceae bacterium]|jgi:hypothetical protein|nr:hypothetical protein [Burkholderiaceae bacterium]MCO5104528.1 hypothetical protein [Burkholderiaceae bacterium]
MMTQGRARTLWQRLAVAAVLLVAAAAVFALYQRPDFLIMLADQVWACF